MRAEHDGGLARSRTVGTLRARRSARGRPAAVHGELRLSHPNAARIGEEVGTDPPGSRSGHGVVNITTGTLGPTARGKVPPRDHTGTIVGEVSAGFSTADIARRARRTAAAFTSAAARPDQRMSRSGTAARAAPSTGTSGRYG